MEGCRYPLLNLTYTFAWSVNSYTAVSQWKVLHSITGCYHGCFTVYDCSDHYFQNIYISPFISSIGAE